MQPCFGLWMLRQQVEGPCQRIRRCLVTGLEDCEYLAAELALAHAFAGLGVARREQERKQIATVDISAFPFGKEARHQSIEGGDRPAIGTRLMTRKPIRQAD